MEYFMGEKFDKEKNKPYKKLEAAEKAAEKQNAAVFDENGAVVKDFRNVDGVAAEPPQPDAGTDPDGQVQQPDTGTDSDGQVQQPDAGTDPDGQVQQSDAGTDPDGQMQQSTMTDDAPEGALDTDSDGNVPTYDANGSRGGMITAEEVKVAEEAVTDSIDGVEAVRISGKIRRVFDGSIRIRKAPSWSNDAVRGAATFAEKTVTHLMMVDGKPMYKTLDGYFVSGDPELVEYMED